MIRPYTSIAWLTLKALHIDCMAYSDDPVEKVIKDLDIDRALHIDCMAYSDDPVEKAIKSFKNHPSILRILQEGNSENNFSFDPIFE